jgi:hypothetical protein
VLLLLEGINSVLLLDDGVLAFFQGFRELKQSGAVGHEKKKKIILRRREKIAKAMDVGTLALIPNVRGFMDEGER